MKCKIECKLRKYRVICLKCEQEKDRGWLWPESIRSVKYTLFDRLEGLTDKQKAALVLKIVGGFSYEKLAPLFGIKKDSVRSIIKRGKKKLQDFKLF